VWPLAPFPPLAFAALAVLVAQALSALPGYLISMVRGLSCSARGMNSANRPLLYSALMASSIRGRVIVGHESITHQIDAGALMPSRSSVDL
jgi:hypothetical protein